MAEIIDYLFLFWVFLTFAVIAIGKVYENLVVSKQKQQQQQEQRRRKVSLDGDILSSSSSWGQRWPSEQQQYTSNSNYGQQQAAYEPFQQAATSNLAYSDFRPSNSTMTSSMYTANEPTDAYGYRQSIGHHTYGQHSAKVYPASQAPDIGPKYSSLEGQLAASEWRDLGASQYQPVELADFVLDGGSIPTATGFNGDCVEWVNQILYLFYSEPNKYAPIISESIYRSLNEKLSSVTSQSMAGELANLSIEFRGINCRLSSRPELTNIRTESESEKSVSAVCKVYNKLLTFDLAIRRSAPAPAGRSQFDSPLIEEPDEDLYELTLENLEGKLKSVAMLADKLIVVQFMEKPDTKILLRLKSSTGSRLANSKLLNEDTLVGLILQTLTQVVVDLYFGDDPQFPQYKQSTGTYRSKLDALKGSASEIKRQIKYDFFGALSSSLAGSDPAKERKIFIKILRANNINYNQNVTCLLKLDSPVQQALSSTKQGSNPYWDEHFLFAVNNKSAELLIELWDSISQPADSSSLKRLAKLSGSSQQLARRCADLTANAKFLGLARVKIDELRRNPVQKVSLLLESSQQQNRRNPSQIDTDLSNSVGGELQLELLFLEHSSSAALERSASGNSLSGLKQGDVVSVDRKVTPSGFVITTTTITKPSASASQQPSAQLRDTSNRLLADQLAPAASNRNASPISSLGEHSVSDLESGGQQNFGQAERGWPLAAEASNSATLDGARSRSRSRSFLRAIRRRFNSFSRTRSRSVGEPSTGDRLTSRSEAPSAVGSGLNLDAISVDSRSRSASTEFSSMAAPNRAKSVPSSRDPNEVPTIVINKSRLSDTASAFTFTHPKSQLVIECLEPGLSESGGNKAKGQLRYYAIGNELAGSRKWRKRGTKLHLFNEHQFVACHLAGSSTCHLCGSVFSRRPGKQGYKCRNCHLLSHKQCHVKVDHNCPYALRDGLKLEYIDADPPASLVLERRGDTMPASSASADVQRRQMGAKSISMEVDDR